MNTITCAASIQSHLPKKDLKSYYDHVKYKTFADYKATLLYTYQTFNPAPIQSGLSYLFCGAPDADSARDFFIHHQSDENTPLNNGATILQETQEKENIFFHRFIDSDHIYDCAILDAIQTGEINYLLEGAELAVRFHYLARYLHKLHQGDKFFLAIQSSRRGVLINDHAAFEHRVLMAYACARPDLAKCFFRKDMGLSSLDTTPVTVNLCLAAMYNDPQLWEKAAQQAKDILKKRKGKALHAHAGFFFGVMEHNADKVSEALAILGDIAPMSYWGQTRDKIININYHGLCAFAREHLPPDIFAQVVIPQAKGWWPELFEATEKLSAPRSFTASRYTFGNELCFLDDKAHQVDKDIETYAR